MLHPLRKIDVERTLWRFYWHGRSEAATNRLVDFYLPWVKGLAIHHAHKCPDSVDWQDLMQDGSVALLDCIRRFNKARGTSFKTFATRRIIGAFADGLRQMDWVPRLVRARKEAAVVMTQFPQTRPSNTSASDFIKEPINDIDGSKNGRYVDRQQYLREEVWHALRGLRQKERLILILYYLDGKNMRQIGDSLGLTESRISQIISRTIEYLRAREGVVAEKSA